MHGRVRFDTGGKYVKKVQTFVAAALLLGMSAIAPVKAADGSDVNTMVRNTARFPIQVAGVATALAVGTPIAIVRRTSTRIHDFTVAGADNIGGHEHAPPVLFASLFGVPAGTIVGVGEGVYMGGRNAFSHGVEHPFGLDSYSMGDDIEQ